MSEQIIKIYYLLCVLYFNITNQIQKITQDNVAERSASFLDIFLSYILSLLGVCNGICNEISLITNFTNICTKIHKKRFSSRCCTLFADYIC